MYSVLTPSSFHFSMKLSSWACAADVSVPVMLSTAVEPVLTFAFFMAGTTKPSTRSAAFWSARNPTVLPLSLPVEMSSGTNTAAACSLVVSGVSSRPGGDSSIHGCSSS